MSSTCAAGMLILSLKLRSDPSADRRAAAAATADVAGTSDGGATTGSFSDASSGKSGRAISGGSTRNSYPRVIARGLTGDVNSWVAAVGGYTPVGGM